MEGVTVVWRIYIMLIEIIFSNLSKIYEMEMMS